MLSYLFSMKTKALIVDIDHTIIDSTIAHIIAGGAYKNCRGLKKVYATMESARVLAGSKILGESWGLNEFSEVLGKFGITKKNAEEYCEVGIKKHQVPGALDYLRDCTDETDLYIVTTGMEIGPNVLSNRYGLKPTGTISNKTVYDKKNVPKGCTISVTDDTIGHQVECILAKYGKEDCMIVDDRPYRYPANGHAIYTDMRAFLREKQ